MFNIKKITNGLIVGVQENDGYKETAFTNDNVDYVTEAKTFITGKKTMAADRAEEQAHTRIDQVINSETPQP